MKKISTSEPAVLLGAVRLGREETDRHDQLYTTSVTSPLFLLHLCLHLHSPRNFLLLLVLPPLLLLLLPPRPLRRHHQEARTSRDLLESSLSRTPRLLSDDQAHARTTQTHPEINAPLHVGTPPRGLYIQADTYDTCMCVRVRAGRLL